jgi:hypothetical protein
MANREDTNAKAIELGLAGAENYPNKGVVEDAIARVEAGEEASAVDNEIVASLDTGDNGDEPSTPASRPKADRTDNVESGQPSNDGHATRFDETGAPKF